MNDDAAERSELERLIDLDEDALLEELGRGLLGEGPNFGPSDFERRFRFTKTWFSERLDHLRSILCGDLRRNLEENGGFERLEAAAAIADALVAAFGRPTANIVAVLVLRHGLAQLCDV
jgi:hypothetical protein